MRKNEPSLKARALGFLARREHTRSELAQKLRTHAESAEELESLLDALVARQLLSDARYAEVRVHQLARKFGVARIAHELRAKGLSKELVERTANTAGATEVERARVVWAKKFKAPAATREDRARQMRFLQSRGFSFETIRAVLGMHDE
jgi:regulatory protein